jgi:hypothetical protein
MSDKLGKCNCNFLQQIKGWDKPDSMFDPKELRMGIEDEMEHTTDPAIAKAIAKGHLMKHPHYYSENDKKHCY